MGDSVGHRRGITNLFIFLSFFLAVVYFGMQVQQKIAQDVQDEPLLSNPSTSYITDVRMTGDSTIEIEYADSTVKTIEPPQAQPRR